MICKPLQHRLVAAFLILSFVLPGVALPVGFQGKQEALAISYQPQNTILNNIQTGIQGGILANITSQNFKEFVLDPIVWALINQIITNMLQELTRWVASGFQGEPAFITSLDDFLLDAADEAFGEFLADSGLEGLCSPGGFGGVGLPGGLDQLNIETALNYQYQQARSNDINECSLSDMGDNLESFLNGNFSDGGWNNFRELVVGPTNDSTKAFLEARERMRRELMFNSGQELTEISTNGWFMNVKECPGGGTDCADSEKITTTPGNMIENRVNEALGLPERRLAFADEFNELIAALLQQFTQQLLGGLTGMLRGGGSGGSGGGFGADGQQSYIDALTEEAGLASRREGENAIDDAIIDEEEYIAINEDIIILVDGAETNLEQAKEIEFGCVNLTLPNSLISEREKAEENIETAEAAIVVLSELLVEYEAAESPEEQLDIMTIFQELQGQGIGMTAGKLPEVQVTRDVTVQFAVDDFNQRVSQEQQRCGRAGR